MSTDEFFNRAALSMVPDLENSPTIFDKKTPGEKRLTGYKITENPDHIAFMLAGVAVVEGLHPQIRVGAVAYDLWSRDFGPPACNHLTPEAEQQHGGFTPFMLMGPLDKKFTVCAEVRAIQKTMFLYIDNNGQLRSKMNRRQRDWSMYTTRLPCKRCRGFVAEAQPLEVVVPQQTTDWLVAHKKGYKEELDDTISFFEERQVRVRHVDLPKAFMTRLFCEVLDDMPSGIPRLKKWRSKRSRLYPGRLFNS